MQEPTWQWRRSVESPWFYIVWFSLFGAIVLFMAQEKYGRRQAGIERRFQARSQAAQPVDGEPDGQDAPPGEGRYSSPDDTVIPLWPLGGLLAAVACLAALLAYRSGLRRSEGKGEEEAGNGRMDE